MISRSTIGPPRRSQPVTPSSFPARHRSTMARPPCQRLASAPRMGERTRVLTGATPLGVLIGAKRLLQASPRPVRVKTPRRFIQGISEKCQSQGSGLQREAPSETGIEVGHSGDWSNAVGCWGEAGGLNMARSNATERQSKVSALLRNGTSSTRLPRGSLVAAAGVQNRPCFPGDHVRTGDDDDITRRR